VNYQHWQLLVLWMMYCIVHSLLAGNKVKNYLQNVMQSSFKYYRPLYSIFAFITLAFILWFQFSFESSWLFTPLIFFQLPGIIAALIGLIIMVICIKKYFYEMSGLQALQNLQAKSTLQQTGLHKYVRHPLYFGTLLFIWGLFLIFPLLNNLIAVIVVTTYVLFGIKLEEKKLKLEFGELYKDYSKRVPQLIPGLKIKPLLRN
jgi:protein-S-isoprenylcysteine O-methyltransferase Ste14